MYLMNIRGPDSKNLANSEGVYHIYLMDFPMFFLDIFGNRLLMAVIASIHVFINHAFAVGAIPLVVLIEWRGMRQSDAATDNLAYRITFVLFIVTTTVGALTGVGIWFTSSLIAPFGIGTLLRIFFWVWFIEWLIFITEVILILVYTLTWKKWITGNLKKLHLGIGMILSVFSWLTMAVIVGILGFMMDSGQWTADKTFFSAFFNPIYLPQLAFRTAFALSAAGLCLWFLMFFFTKKGTELRKKGIRIVSRVLLVLAVPFAAASAWYWNVVPEAMASNIDVALLTQRFADWHEKLAILMAAAIGAIIIAAIVGAIKPKLIPSVALIIPFVLGLWLMGHFERVREFIRKPYVVADYMYSNGVRVADLPVFQRDGVLPYSAFVQNRSVTSSNKVDAGRDVFLVACSRCHTTSGLNSVRTKFTDLYGEEPWEEAPMIAYIQTMHISRTFMPPFPGNDAEAEALVAYLKSLQAGRRIILDAPTMWGTESDDQNQPAQGP